MIIGVVVVIVTRTHRRIGGRLRRLATASTAHVRRFHAAVETAGIRIVTVAP